MAILTRGDVVQGQPAVVLIEGCYSVLFWLFCSVQLCLFCGLLAEPVWRVAFMSEWASGFPECLRESGECLLLYTFQHLK